MRKLALVFTIFSLLFFYSCRENDQIGNEYRADLDLKSELTQKQSFKGFTTANKVLIWQSKINQIKSQNVNFEQKQILEKIYSEVENVEKLDYDGIKLFELAIEMAKITPQDEYVRMFEIIGDYTRNEKMYQSGTIDNEFIIMDLQNYLTKLKNSKEAFYSNNNSSIAKGKPTCNCKWTCAFYGGSTNDNCNSSTSGCGFLWIQECTGYVG